MKFKSIVDLHTAFSQEEIEVKDKASVSGRVVFVNKPKKTEYGLYQVITVAEPGADRNAENAKIMVGIPKEPFLTRDDVGNSIEIVGAVVKEWSDGTLALHGGTWEITDAPKKRTTSRGRRNGARNSNGQPRQDYCVVACGVAAFWHVLIKEFDIPEDAIDAVIKPVTSIGIDLGGLDTGKVLRIGRYLWETRIKPKLGEVLGDEAEAKALLKGIDCIGQDKARLLEKLRDQYEVPEKEWKKLLHGMDVDEARYLSPVQAKTVHDWLKEFKKQKDEEEAAAEAVDNSAGVEPDPDTGDEEYDF